MLQAMKDLLPQTPPEGNGKAKAVSQGHNENASLDQSQVGEDSVKSVTKTRAIRHLRTRAQHTAFSPSGGRNTMALLDTFKPFKRYIIEEKLSDRLKLPTLQYDGTSDP
ncbi:hypothetical protein L2V44_14125, partial [Staphylococcus aureus]|nr:hypothetical protein [Staphylococcus aureus]